MNATVKFRSGYWSADQYGTYREAQQRKLDVFYANDRLTEAQYEELIGLWIE